VNAPSRISVVVCTRDRAALLPLAVRSLFTQSLPFPAFELIVVNNASTDRTPAVLSGLRAEGPAALPLHVVDEPRPGLSHARNTGLARARGALVAFLDDDAVADPGWLAALTSAFARSERIAAVGGPIRPIWPRQPPSWLTDPLRSYYGILDHGREARPIDTEREWLVGANIAFRRSALLEVGGFARALGRQAATLLSNEEIDVVHKLVRRGHHAWYAPDATVAHHVHPGQLSRRWLLRRAFWQGISDSIMRNPTAIGNARPSARRVDWVLLRALSAGWISDCYSGYRPGRAMRMEHLADRAVHLGRRFAAEVRG
jgi:glycosyltransferase involved in cell wall biosynthesis